MTEAEKENNRKRGRLYRERHRERIQVSKREKYVLNRERILDMRREQYARNPEKYRADRITFTRRLRMEVLLAYGAECTCCGERRYEFLALDHVNSDGAEHRKTVRTDSIALWARKNNYPDTLQILCHNCNLAKGFYGTCPHVHERNGD